MTSGVNETGSTGQALIIGLTAVLACLLATLAQQLMKRRQLAACWAAEASKLNAKVNDQAADLADGENAARVNQLERQPTQQQRESVADAVPFTRLPSSLKRAEQAKILEGLSAEELQLERDAVLSQLRQICGILAERQGGSGVSDKDDGLSEACLNEVRSQMRLYA